MSILNGKSKTRLREIRVGQPNAIGKSLVEFLHSGTVLHSERFDVFSVDESDKAIKRYFGIAGLPNEKKEIDKLRLAIQTKSQADDQQEHKVELLGIDKFIQQHPTLKEPVIDRILRRGESCNIISSAKVGKSWLAGDLALSIATGSKWLKEFDTTKGNVVYLDFELQPETFAYRLREIARERQVDLSQVGRSFIPISLRGLGYDIFTLSKIIDQLGDVSAIVLDCWYKVLGSTNENDNSQVGRCYSKLESYANQLGCSFIVIHHTSKGDQSSKSVVDVGSGASALARSCDTHIVIRQHETDGLSVMESVTRSFPPMEPLSMFFTWPCWYRSTEQAQVKTAKSAASASKEQQRKQDVESVVVHFANGKPFSWYEVSRLIGCGECRALNVILAGEKSGSIVAYKKLKRKQARKSTMTYKVVERPTERPTGKNNVVLSVGDT